MKRLKKTISVFFAVCLSLCLFSADALQFDCTDELVKEIAKSVMNSRCVTQRPLSKRKRSQSRRGAADDLRETRIALLRSILENSDLSDSLVKGVISQYLRDGHVPGTSYEAIHLRQTANVEELRHNIASLVEAYNRAKY